MTVVHKQLRLLKGSNSFVKVLAPTLADVIT